MGPVERVVLAPLVIRHLSFLPLARVETSLGAEASPLSALHAQDDRIILELGQTILASRTEDGDSLILFRDRGHGPQFHDLFLRREPQLLPL